MAEPLRRTLSKLRGRRSQRGAAGGGHRHGGTCAPQADLIENVYIAPRSRKEPKSPKASEVPEHRPQMNSITVSKKRNWLHQSTHRAPCPEGESTCKKMQGAVTQVPKSPSPQPTPKTQRARAKSSGGQECPVRGCGAMNALPSTTGSTVLRRCAFDFGEDNDADDEGEIWYNPIPEDDEPDVLRVLHPSANNPVATDCPAGCCKSVPSRVLGWELGPHSGPPGSPERAGDTQPGELGPADAMRPGEHLQQRQRFACKIQGVPAAEDNPAFRCPSTVDLDRLNDDVKRYSCTPRNYSVNLREELKLTNVVFFPRCLLVQRCGGNCGCGTSNWKSCTCVSGKMVKKYHEVLKFVPEAGHPRRKGRTRNNMALVDIQLDHHERCDCVCSSRPPR